MRKTGPVTTHGERTVSGLAGEIPVHWIGTRGFADRLERYYSTANSLTQLLIRNSFAYERITSQEYFYAMHLIKSVPEGEGHCIVCELFTRRALVETGLCREHSLYTLEVGARVWPNLNL